MKKLAILMTSFLVLALMVVSISCGGKGTPTPTPEASISLDVSGTAPFTVQFRDTSQGPVTSCQWDFGDGASSTEQNPAHEYTKAGTFSVRLTVSGPGGTDVIALLDAIHVSPGPLATIEVQPTSVIVEKGATREFTAAGFDQYGNAIPELAFRWEATGGQIDQAGLFTGVGRFGRYQVTASATFMDSSATGAAAIEILPIWIPASKPISAHAYHTATLLADGKVLIAGGFAGGGWGPLAELYHPATGTFSATGSPLVGHVHGPTATRLIDGRVLLVGGDSQGPCAEIYDPATGLFTQTGSPNVIHIEHTATLLPDGRVLIAGGQEPGTSGCPPGESYAVAEIYDPATGTFSLTGTLNAARSCHTATLLPSGEVLITGGMKFTSPGASVCLDSAELYDPTAGTFSVIGNMGRARCNHRATLLSNGNVLITGGAGAKQLFAEVFDAATGSFRTTGEMNTLRQSHTATLLADGRVLIAGGQSVEAIPGGTDLAELYDPVTEAFTAIDSMSEARWEHTATLLPNGQVLVVGGFFEFESDIGLRSAELLD